MIASDRGHSGTHVDSTGRLGRRSGIRLSLRATATLLSVVAALAGSSIVLAQTETSPKLMTGGAATIPAGQVITHDLYVLAGTIVVDGRIQGDLVAAGGRVELNGSVDGDLNAAAGAVEIRGPVAGDFRAAGATVVVSTTVEEDAVVSGGSITVDRASIIREDLIVSGGRLDLAGTVGGDLVGSAGTRTGGGAVGGTDSLVTGAAGTASAADVAFDAVRHLLAVAALGGIGLLIAPRLLPIASGNVRRKPLRSMVWGVATLLGAALAVALIVLAGVVIALTLGAAGYGSLVALELLAVAVTAGAIGVGVILGSAFLADAVVGLAIATLVLRSQGTTRRNTLLLVVLGAAVVVAATSIPVAGPWIKALVVLIGVGGLTVATRAIRHGGSAVPGV